MNKKINIHASIVGMQYQQILYASDAMGLVF